MGELMALAVETDAQIYSISLFDPGRRKPIELREEQNGILRLQSLTQKTGGIQLIVRDPVQAEKAARQIAAAIRDQ